MARDGAVDRDVDVVVTAFNQAPYLERAVRSALEQTAPPRQVVVVDDGSSDDLAGALAALAGRVRIVRQENAGVASARARGLAETRAPLVAFLDGDDLWLPGKLERQVDALRGHPAAPAVTVGWDLIDARDSPLGPGPAIPDGDIDFPRLYAANPIVSPSVALVRRAAIEAAGGFDRRLRYVGDYDLWLKLARRAPLRHLGERLARYRLHGQNASLRLPLEMAEEEELVFATLDREGLPAGVPQALVRSRRAHIARAVAYNRLLAGRPAAARPRLWQALRDRPASPRTWVYLGFSYLPAGAARAVHRWRRGDSERTREAEGIAE